MRWGSERGQATVEWVGLVLALALACGAAIAAAVGADFGRAGRGVGEALAGGITCAARDACRAEAAAMGELRSHRARRLRAWTSAPPEGFGRRGIRPSAPWERAPRGLRGLEAANSGVLRALGRAGRHAGEFGWLACLGYQQWRYDYEHPRSPRESMPVDAVLDELNTCFNPIGWMFP